MIDRGTYAEEMDDRDAVVKQPDTNLRYRIRSRLVEYKSPFIIQRKGWVFWETVAVAFSTEDAISKLKGIRKVEAL